MSSPEMVYPESFEKILKPKEPLLREYCSILASYSGKVRLTGPSDPDILWNEHILDCCSALSFLPEEGTVLDLGTGGGLPGIAWAICRPDLEIHLLDSIRKKCTALEQIIRDLSLKNVKVICSRSEELAKTSREHYHMVAARAVTSTGVLLEYMTPLVKPGGMGLALKGPAYIDETDGLDERWSELGFSSPRIWNYILGSSTHYILVWEKLRTCPAGLPRRPGMAEKKPWWRCNLDHTGND